MVDQPVSRVKVPPRSPVTDAALAAERAARDRIAAANEARRAAGVDRLRAVLALKDAGWTYAQIGAAIGIARGRAQALVDEAKRELRPNGT